MLLAHRRRLWASPSIQEIIDYIDTNYQLRSDMTAQARITTKDPEQGTKVIESVLYRRDKDDAFLIVLAEPETERGNGYLRVGDNMWLYRRTTRTFTHIGRDEKIGGSNTTAGDIETRKFKELYKPSLDASGKEILSEETIGSAKIPVYRLEVVAQVNDVKYPEAGDVGHPGQVPRAEARVIQPVRHADGDRPVHELQGRRRAVTCPFSRSSPTRWKREGPRSWRSRGIAFSKVDDYKFDKSYLESLSK